MANDGLSAGDRWARTVVEEIRRFKSLRRCPGRILRYTPMPPEARAEFTKALGIWPLPQSKRDGIVDAVAKKMSGLIGTFVLRHGVIPEPDASRAAAAVEAEAFAAASANAADKDLTSEQERYEVFRMYVRDLWSRVYRYAESRPQAAAGTSSSARAGPAALPPPAASVSGPVQQLLVSAPRRRRSRGV